MMLVHDLNPAPARRLPRRWADDGDVRVPISASPMEDGSISQDDPETFGRATSGGGHRLYLKDITPENLLNALRAAYENPTILSPTISRDSPASPSTTRDE